MKKETSLLLDKGKRALNAAKLLYDNGDYDFSASRAYYSMFYVAEAALLEEGKTFSKHSGVIDGFYHQFIATEKLPRKLHQIFHQAFQDRQNGDYGFLEMFLKKDAKELLQNTTTFIKDVEKLLKNTIF